MTLPNPQSDHYVQWLKLGKSEDLGIGNFFEYIIQLIYASVLQPGGLAIDCGANRGMHTFPLVRSVGMNGKVVAYEPIPTLAANLACSIDAQGIKNIVIRPVALGASTGEIQFYYLPDFDYISGIKISSNVPVKYKQKFERIQVPMVSLDEDLIETDSVRFLKLDLEGGEYHALIGAKRIMEQHRPLIVFENTRQGSASTYGYNRDDLFNIFEASGYFVFDILGRRFRREDWDKPDFPWYFIAAQRPDDLQFIRSKLGHLIGLISTILTRHSNLS